MVKRDRRNKIIKQYHAMFGIPKKSLEGMPLDYIFERSLAGISEEEYISNRKSGR